MTTSLSNLKWRTALGTRLALALVPNVERIAEMRRLKIKIVGDGNVGKTCFLIRWYNDNFPPLPSESNRPIFPSESVPSVQDPFYSSLTVDRKSYILSYWDTIRGSDYQKFRWMEYEETDIFIACFDIANPSSFQNVSTVWVPELKHYMPETPILVVGNKKDLRSSAALPGMVSVSKGHELAERLGTTYLENSAKTGDGMREVLVTAVRLATQNTQPSARGKFWVFQRPKRKSSKGLRCGPYPPLLSPPGPVPAVAVESSTFAEDLQRMFETNRCCDVKFVFSDNSSPIDAHKMALCMGSPVFRDYFLNGGMTSGLSSLLVKELLSTAPAEITKEHSQVMNVSRDNGLTSGGKAACKLKSKSVVYFEQNVCRTSFASIVQFLYTGLPCVSKTTEVLPTGIIGLTQLQKSLHSYEFNGELYLGYNSLPSCTAVRGTMAKKLFLNQPDLSDVTFCIENSRVYAHRALLMARSEVMSAMLGGGFSESESNEIRVEDATVSAFLALLEYLYSDHIPDDATIPEYKELLILADRFCLPRLINLCEQAISQGVSTELDRKPVSKAVYAEVIILLLLSQAHNASQLAEWCLYVITTNYPECESCGEFDLITGDNRRHVIEHRWPPLSYLKELEEFKRQTGRV